MNASRLSRYPTVQGRPSGRARLRPSRGLPRRAPSRRSSPPATEDPTAGRHPPPLPPTGHRGDHVHRRSVTSSSSSSPPPSPAPPTRSRPPPIPDAAKRQGPRLRPQLPPRPDGTPSPSPPAEALKHFKLRPGYAVDLIAAEPAVRQPLYINFDERGRMWVTQYIQYPFPAGLKVVEYDRYIRAKFDKTPPPAAARLQGRRPHHHPRRHQRRRHVRQGHDLRRRPEHRHRRPARPRRRLGA